MTAKEKAEELFDKMAFEVCGTDAKICALIAVNQILENNYGSWMQMQYWEEVKQEIEKI